MRDGDIPERRRLEEVLFHHEIEPDSRSLFVEGSVDVGLWRHLLSDSETADVAVYEIDLVDIDGDFLIGRGLEDSRQGRVFGLASWLEENCSGSLCARVVCVADRDFGVFEFARIACSRYLVVTDATSIEMYLFTAEALDKFFRVALRVDLRGEEAVEVLGPALRELFCLRAASIRLGWGLSWISPTRCMELQGELVAFNREEYLVRYLRSRLPERETFESVVDALRNELGRDPRKSGRGHDFIEILGWFVKSRVGSWKLRRLDEPQALAAALLASMDTEAWRRTDFFTEVRSRFLGES